MGSDHAPAKRRSWWKVLAAVVGVLVLLLIGAYGLAYVSTDSSGLARAMVWMDADVLDYRRFPARAVSAPTESWDFQAPDPSWNGVANRVEVAGVFSSGEFEDFLTRTQTTSFIVARDQQLIYERYFNGHERGSWETSFSVVKSIVSALVGAAIDEGAIDSIDDPITKWIPELEDRGPRFAEIRVRDLLTMSSGLRFEEKGLPWSDDTKTYYWTDLRKLAMEETEIVGPPGVDFHYNPYNTLLLGLILERSTNESVAEYTRRILWAPLGAEYDATWSLDSEDSSFEKMESGFNARAIDFTKFGRLYLNGGEWNGRQVIPAEWVEESTAVDAQSDPSDFYQYHWWTHRHDEAGQWFLALGNKGQFVAVFPELDMVVSRFGKDFGYEHWPQLFPEIALSFDELAPRTSAEEEPAKGGLEESKAVTFRARDGVRLEGALFEGADAKAAIVLSHMGRPEDTQEDWWPLAAALHDRGYTVLTYNRRGICNEDGTTACSGGSDDLERSWNDVVGAATFLREQGHRKVVLGGASIGAMASLYALEREPNLADGLFWFAGIDNGSGYEFGPPDVGKLKVPALIVSTRLDQYLADESARNLARWWNDDRQLVLTPGGEHGTDIWTEGNPRRAELLTQRVLSLLRRIDRSR